ncbi:hypothetical protein OUZ56_018235 [Daphnia magna]|uniref:Uncharacterized protein n=1 Tax=Daphnia magna TaxID=35525 RepID=A0ABQ9Z8D4_9CRUS|nr:hypothetical protein OUZ56_018235 [Daphnia magna]
MQPGSRALRCRYSRPSTPGDGYGLLKAVLLGASQQCNVRGRLRDLEDSRSSEKQVPRDNRNRRLFGFALLSCLGCILEHFADWRKRVGSREGDRAVALPELQVVDKKFLVEGVRRAN